MAEKRNGRRTKLTPEVQERIVRAVRSGDFFNVACQHAGIGVSTGWLWMERGEAGERPYLDFMEAVKKAEADAETESIARIRKAGQGGRPITKRVTKVYPDGTKEITETIEEAGPEWQADAWYLERKYKDRWGRMPKPDDGGKADDPLRDLAQAIRESREGA